MAYIEKGMAIGLAAAAGIGSFIIGLFVVIIAIAALWTLVSAVGKGGDNE